MAQTLSQPNVFWLAQLLTPLVLKDCNDRADPSEGEPPISAVTTVPGPGSSNPIILEPIVHGAFVACAHHACSRQLGPICRTLKLTICLVYEQPFRRPEQMLIYPELREEATNVFLSSNTDVRWEQFQVQLPNCDLSSNGCRVLHYLY